MNLSGLIAVIEGGEVVEVRDLGPDLVPCKPGKAQPLVESKPELGPRQQYGAPTFEIGADTVTRHWPVEDLPPLTKIPKDYVWRRASDAEAETMESLMSQQSVRLKRIYEGATYVSTTDEYYPDLLHGLTAAFGQSRAFELLEPTE